MKKTKNATTCEKDSPTGGWIRLIILTVVLFLPFSSLQAAPSLTPFKLLSFQMDSRTMGARALEDGGPVFQDTIRAPGANWVRLRFGECGLGAGSHVIITSLEDGADPRLDATAMADYRSRSAIFNGGGLTVALYADPADDNAFITIDAIYFGEPGDALGDAVEDGDLLPEELCGGDSRVSVVDPAVAR